MPTNRRQPWNALSQCHWAVQLKILVKASINILLDVLRSAQAEATMDESDLIQIHQGLSMRAYMYLSCIWGDMLMGR